MVLCALLPPANVTTQLVRLQTQLFRITACAAARALPPVLPLVWLEQPYSQIELVKRKCSLADRLRLDGYRISSGILYAAIVDRTLLAPLLSALQQQQTTPQIARPLSDETAPGSNISPAAPPPLPTTCGFYLGILPNRSTLEKLSPPPSLALRTCRLLCIRLQYSHPIWWQRVHWTVESATWIKCRA